jgi:hypothetical protein
MAELLIRPTNNDHVAIADLLAPPGNALIAPVRRPISRLVLDAPLAVSFPQYREAAADSGTPVLVDPLTQLLQTDTDPEIGWAKLPYARNEKLPPNMLANPFLLPSMVEQVVEFQVAQGASAIVAPYFYAQSTDDPAFEASLEALRLTARYLRTNHPGLPLVAILCGAHRGFARTTTYTRGIDRFAAIALDLGPQTLALCLSPNGAGDEGEAKVLELFTTGQRLKATGAHVIAWRQGFYGPSLVAAGLDGYETGTGVGERTNMAGLARNRAPGCRDGDGGFTHTPVYFDALGRSVANKTAKLLLEQRAVRAQLVCHDVRCCPHGADSMINAQRRQHNIRTRARSLRDLEQMPHSAWRLHQVAKDAYAAALMTNKVNTVLSEEGEKTKLPTRGHESLAQVAGVFSRSSESHAA